MTRTRFRSLALLLGAMLIAPAVAPGADSARVPALADVYSFGTGIQFLPNLEYRKAVLLVKGQDRLASYSFEAGETPTLELTDEDGSLLPDGTYSWRLELLPTAEAARELMIAHKKGELVSSPYEAQSGSFTITGGYLEDETLPEPEPLRETGSPVVADLGTGIAGGRRASEALDADGAQGFGVLDDGALVEPNLQAPGGLDKRLAEDSDALAPQVERKGRSAATALLDVGSVAPRKGASLIKENNGRPATAKPRQ